MISLQFSLKGNLIFILLFQNSLFNWEKSEMKVWSGLIAIA